MLSHAFSSSNKNSSSFLMCFRVVLLELHITRSFLVEPKLVFAGRQAVKTATWGTSSVLKLRAYTIIGDTTGLTHQSIQPQSLQRNKSNTRITSLLQLA